MKLGLPSDETPFRTPRDPQAHLRWRFLLFANLHHPLESEIKYVLLTLLFSAGHARSTPRHHFIHVGGGHGERSQDLEGDGLECAGELSFVRFRGEDFQGEGGAGSVENVESLYTCSDLVRVG